jgi:quinoprotein glucose dehydrogenase
MFGARARVLSAAAFAVVVATGISTLHSQTTPPAAEWSYYGGDLKFQRYSSLDQINKSNVGRLKIAWRRPGVNPEMLKQFPTMRVNAYLRATPTLVNGILYVPNAIGLITAVNPETGETIWEQRPNEMSLQGLNGVSSRGVAVWKKGDVTRIIGIRNEFLYALSAEDGEPPRGFGERGMVNLNRDNPRASSFRWTSGPIVVGDVIVVAGNGGGGGDSASTEKEAAPEDVRGYDAQTGKLLWTFHVIPKPDEPGADSWPVEFLKDAGDAGAWVPVSADPELGLVYIPLSAPTAAFFGGHRKGDNLYTASTVALDAKTGKKVWHYQFVHHDLWETDTVAPPVLGDITVDGKRIKAMMQASKNGFVYVLDRQTGQPVWPIVERPVPQSTVPGEYTSPTQPFPTKPPAFDRQGVTDADLIDYTPELKAQAREILKDYVIGPIYTPASLLGDKKGTYFLPGNWGAGNWHTGAFDPETGMYYAISHTLPGHYALVPPPPDRKSTMQYISSGGAGRGVPTIDGLPLVKGPYGRITAYDMNKGDIAWMKANGDGPRNHPLLKGLNLPPLGVPSRPAPLVTRTLLLLGEGSNTISGNWTYDWAWGKKFRAYDKATGEVVWETELPSGTTGAPMTYTVKGKQYIVVAVGDRETPPEFVALSLP